MYLFYPNVRKQNPGNSSRCNDANYGWWTELMSWIETNIPVFKYLWIEEIQQLKYDSRNTTAEIQYYNTAWWGVLLQKFELETKCLCFPSVGSVSTTREVVTINCGLLQIMVVNSQPKGVLKFGSVLRRFVAGSYIFTLREQKV